MKWCTRLPATFAPDDGGERSSPAAQTRLCDDGLVIAVRSVRAEEADQLRTIRLAALEADPSAFGRTHAEELAYGPEHWEMRATGSGTSQTFVAVDEMFVGLVGVHVPAEGAAAELVSMWTMPSERGRGTGRQLVEAALAWAMARNAPAVELWVTRGNDPALRLYERCGFEVTGDVASSAADPCREEIRMRRVADQRS